MNYQTREKYYTKIKNEQTRLSCHWKDKGFRWLRLKLNNYREIRSKTDYTLYEKICDFV